MSQTRSSDLFCQTAKLLGTDTDNDDIGTSQGCCKICREGNAKRQMKIFILTL